MTRILVVEDDAAVRLAMKTLLELEGFDVTLVEDGCSCLEVIGTRAFDVAIVDMFMPGMTGWDTIKALRERAPEIPVIAMSGLVDDDRHGREPDFLSMARQLGAAGSLRKPFRPNELLAALEACLVTAAGSEQEVAAATATSMSDLADPPRAL